MKLARKTQKMNGQAHVSQGNGLHILPAGNGGETLAQLVARLEREKNGTTGPVNTHTTLGNSARPASIKAPMTLRTKLTIAFYVGGAVIILVALAMSLPTLLQ